MAAVNCWRLTLLALDARKVDGATFEVGTAELKRLEEGEVAELHVPGGTGEEGDRLMFDKEDERESIGWNDWDDSEQNDVTSGENARTSETYWASGVKVCASGLKVWLAACTSLSVLSFPSSSFRSEYRILTGPFSPIL